MKQFLVKYGVHVAAVLVFYLISILNFLPQFQGKQIPQGDIMSFKGMAKEIIDYREATGKQALWTGSMFGGMPTYQISVPQKNNVFNIVKDILQGGMARPAGYFFLGMLAFYLCLIVLGVNPWLAIIGSFAYAFTSNNLILYEAGHTSKLEALMSAPIIIAGLIFAYRKHAWIGSAIFLLGMSLNILSNHIQMSYYLMIILGLYVLIELGLAIKAKQYKSFLISSGALLLALALSFGTSASKIWTTYEYSRDTMRGKPILEHSGQVSSSSETEGLEWEYAMNWSNGFIDVMASLIPGVAGGGSAEPIKSTSASSKEYRKFGIRTKEAPLYWGALPFTSGPVYFGAVIWFLAILGLVYWKSPLKWWLAAAILLSLLMSMGKHFPINRLFFDYFPLYNKFRAPSSMTSITAILLPILAMGGLWAFIKNEGKRTIKEQLVKIYIAAGVVAGVCLVMFLAGPGLFDFTGVNDAGFQQQGFDSSAFVKDRKSLLQSDSLRSLAFVLLSATALFLYAKTWLKSHYLFIVLGALVLFDLMPVGHRYINHDDFVSKRIMEQQFQPRPVDQQILQDNDPHYRVLDNSISTFNSSRSSYYHKTIGGYHAAKLQRYQDLIDRHIMPNNERVLNMLNTKYVIQNNQNNQPYVQRNPAALGNAWFVNNIIWAKDANEEIDALASFEPNGDAVVHEEFRELLEGLSPSKNGYIKLKEYSPNRISYEMTTNTEQLAVFSEIWYGPNKGWKSYIDGVETEHLRVNYALRGLRVPPGSHEIVFAFDPASYRIGEKLSLIFSILSLVWIAFWGYKRWFA